MTYAHRQPTVRASAGTANPASSEAAGIPDCLADTASPSRGSSARARARLTAVWLAALASPATTRKPTTAGKDRAVAARATWTRAVTAKAAVIWLPGPIR